MSVTRDDVINCYRYILGREPENEQVINDCISQFVGVKPLIDAFVNSVEFKNQHYPAHRLAGYLPQDLAVLIKYLPARLETEAGFVTDWLGIKHRLEDLPFLNKSLSGRAIAGIPVPDDGFHAEAIEYLSLFAAIESSGESFTMMELGAGWGPWLTASGVVAKRKGKKTIRLVGVEGEGNKLPLIRRHVHKNGLCPSEEFENHTENEGLSIELCHGVINDGTAVEFPVVGIEGYGASLVTNTPFANNPVEKVNGYTMTKLTKNLKEIDLVHIDIQGYEAVLIREQVKIFADKVRYIAVGTHSREIESFLIGFLPEHGFRLMRETPCSFFFREKPKSMVDATNVDGFQLWGNNRLVPNEPF